MTDLIKRDDAPEPCPFCGGEVTIYRDENVGLCWLQCPKDSTCIGSGLNTCFLLKLEAEAIAAWNTHPAADRIEELLELNQELTLQLLAVHGQAADALDKAVVAEAKLIKAEAYLQKISRHANRSCAAIAAHALAELEGK